MIKAVLAFILCLNPLGCLSKKMEPFVVGGNFSRIKDFPHSAYLEAFCGRDKEAKCGGSILNQWMLLTAAHCMPSHNCTSDQHITARVGDANKTNGIKIMASKFKAHEKYYEDRLRYDIALVMLEKPLKLSENIGRVAIMNKRVSTGETGIIAGWGFVNELPKKRTNLLKHVYQKTMKRERCEKILGSLPEGVFCAYDLRGISHPAGGDSGCALVVDRYIQVGLVSFKLPIEPTIVVYTEIAYFYDWIHDNAMDLFCRSGLKPSDYYDAMK